MAERLLTMPVVADRLGYTRSSVYRLVKAGQLPVVQVGGVWRVREADLDEFIRSLPAVAS